MDSQVQVAEMHREEHATDDPIHPDRVLMTELRVLSSHLGDYVMRYYDAVTGRTDPISTVGEWALADTVASAAEDIRARAERRRRQGEL